MVRKKKKLWANNTLENENEWVFLSDKVLPWIHNSWTESEKEKYSKQNRNKIGYRFFFSNTNWELESFK